MKTLLSNNLRNYVHILFTISFIVCYILTFYRLILLIDIFICLVVTTVCLFLSRVSILTRDIVIGNLSVCLSVCPSVTFRYQMKTAEHIVIVFSPYGSPIILVLPASNTFTKFRRGHPLRGAKYRWGIKNSRFSTNKSL